MENQVETVKYTPEKAKQNALAKLDLIRKWQEFRRKAVNKLQADYDFVKLHNTSNSHFVVFRVKEFVYKLDNMLSTY